MRESTPRWTLGSGQRIAHALACVVGFDLWQLLAFALLFGVLRFPPADLWKGHPVVIATTVLSGGLAMVCVVWLGIVRLGRVSWRDLGWHSERLGLSLGLGVLGTALLAGCVLGNLAAAGALREMNVLATITSYTPAQRLLFLGLGLSAAAVEESLFRGYLQPALVAKIGLVAGIVLGAVVFAAYHVFFMGPDVRGLLGKVPAGIVLGALRGRQGSLLAPLLAHFFFWQIFGSL